MSFPRAFSISICLSVYVVFLLHLITWFSAEHQHNVNETDDKKVEKNAKKKGSKRKIDSPKYWKEMKFSVRTIKGHHHPLCAVDFDEEHILSGGYVNSILLLFCVSILTRPSYTCLRMLITMHFIFPRHDTSLKIWNANNYEEIFSLGGHTGRISVLLLISANKVVTGSQDCSIIFWDVKAGIILFYCIGEYTIKMISDWENLLICRC